MHPENKNIAKVKNRILRLITIFLQLVVIFMIARGFFLLINSRLYTGVSAADVFAMFTHGLGMDLSMAGYFTAIPAVFIVISLFLPNGCALDNSDRFLCLYMLLASFLIALAASADALLYPYWGFKLDTTPLFYFLSSPSSALASASAWEIAAAVGMLLILWLVFAQMLLICIRKLPLNPLHGRKIVPTIVMVLLTGLLFLPIRGGVTVSTMNLSNAYFSDDARLNHGAVNPLFSFMYSATTQNNFADQFNYFAPNEAESVLAEFEKGLSVDSVAAIKLTNLRPDIYLVILESFSAHLLPSLGGDSVAMKLDSIAQSGILFRNLYASSFRTDRALPAILSGYPAQPTTSIMKFVEKTDNLPSLPRSLKSNGYNLSYYYGGDVNFTNMKAYLVSAGFDEIVSDKDFPVGERLSKWGVHDDKVFSRHLADLKHNNTSSPRLTVIQTSSSHEPFQVPYTSQFDNERLNAFAYADNSLGNWIDSLQRTPSWNNSLVVLVPDHFSAWPRNLTDQAQRHHIPAVMTGGALQTDSLQIDAVCAQTDLAATILTLLDIDSSDLIFSRNILDPSTPRYAFFSEPEKATIVTSSDTATVSVTTGDVVCGQPLTANAVKAYMQTLYKDFQNR